MSTFQQYQRVEYERKRHYEIDSKRIYPSSTTILSVKANPAIPPWASKMAAQYAAEKNHGALDELLLSFDKYPKKQWLKETIVKMVSMLQNALSNEEYIKDVKGAPWRKSGDAMDIGTLVHDMISEFHIDEIKWRERGKEYSSAQAKNWFIMKLKSDEIRKKKLKKDVSTKLKNCLGQFLKWREDVNFVIVSSEFTVYSDDHKFAGTVDALGYVNDKLTLVDYKTSSGIWPDYDLQTSSYLCALLEMIRRKQAPKLEDKPEQMCVVNFTKEGKLDTKMVENYKEALNLFLAYKDSFNAKQIWEAKLKMALAEKNE